MVQRAFCLQRLNTVFGANARLVSVKLPNSKPFSAVLLEGNVMKQNLRNLLLQCLLILGLMLAATPIALAGKQTSVSGPSFTSTSEMVYVGDEWHKQGIAYEEWAANTDLAVTLDQHLYPALLPIIQDWGKSKNLNIAVQEGTCGISAGKLRKKTVDIGGFCCPPGLTDRLPGLKYHTLGIGALALLVHKDNPVEEIDLETARAIFRGKYNHWQALGEDLPAGFGKNRIRPYTRLHCKARPGHWRLLLDNEDMFSPRLIDVSSIPDMVSSIEQSRMSIGYEMVWMVMRYSDENKIKLLRLNGHSPTNFAALISGNYPLYRTYNITTWKDTPAKNAIVEELANYLIDNFNQVNPKYGIVSAQELRSAGWIFQENELVGEPQP